MKITLKLQGVSKEALLNELNHKMEQAKERIEYGHMRALTIEFKEPVRHCCAACTKCYRDTLLGENRCSTGKGKSTAIVGSVIEDNECKRFRPTNGVVANLPALTGKD